MASQLRDYLRLSPPFHRINVADASLSLLHARPFIFARPGFLTAHECAQLRDKARHALSPQTFDARGGGGARTSRGCVARDDEVAGVRRRLASLARVSVGQVAERGDPLTHTHEPGTIPGTACARRYSHSRSRATSPGSALTFIPTRGAGMIVVEVSRAQRTIDGPTAPGLSVACEALRSVAPIGW